MIPPSLRTVLSGLMQDPVHLKDGRYLRPKQRLLWREPACSSSRGLRINLQVQPRNVKRSNGWLVDWEPQSYTLWGRDDCNTKELPAEILRRSGCIV